MDPKLKLKAVEEQIATLRAQRDMERRSLQHSDKRAGGDSTSSAGREAQATRERIATLDQKIESKRTEQAELLNLVAGNGNGHYPTEPSTWRQTPGWDSHNVLGTEAVSSALASIGSSSAPTGSQRMMLGQIISSRNLADSFGGKALAATPVTGTDSLRRGTSVGVVPPLRRQLNVLDLIPATTMEGRSVPYTIEGGNIDTARETAEGALKPESALTLTDAEATAVTIAHWLKVARQTLADAPALHATLDGRLRFGVLLRLQNEILAGDGLGANLRGILNTSGIGAVPYDAAQLPADQVLSGITTVAQADGEANGIVMHPLNIKQVLTAKAAGDGHYYSGGPFVSQSPSLWGVPLIPSNAIAQGMALVGDFASGAYLFIREGVNVLLSDADTDDFERNLVTILAEMRAALAVPRPAAFCSVDLAA